MIRDTTQIINLTSIVNMIISGLVGGIVIYTIQKKIDATIQKSLFVSQTKFSAIHSKTVETLATLFDKSALLMNKYLDILREVEQNKSFVFDHDYDILSKHGEDFLDYYDRTRLFLDETAKDEMQKYRQT